MFDSTYTIIDRRCFHFCFLFSRIADDKAFVTRRIASMLKTTRLKKALYDTQPPSSTTSSSSCDTEPSSICSSYKSHASTNESTVALIHRIEKLEQAKSQLAILYKVSLNSGSRQRRPCPILSAQVKCKSDLDKAATITKLRLHFEHELNTFCKQDQKDLVNYLQRQMLAQDQRLAEQAYEIEKSRLDPIQSNDVSTVC